jgi:hypothetical protein
VDDASGHAVIVVFVEFVQFVRFAALLHAPYAPGHLLPSIVAGFDGKQFQEVDAGSVNCLVCCPAPNVGLDLLGKEGKLEK